MSIKLSKGKGISLNKGIGNVKLRVTWNEDIDIDVHALVLKDNRVEEDGDFVFYGSEGLKHPSGAITHSPDARDGGEEYIDIDFSKIPSQKNRILLLATIDKGAIRGQHFGQCNSAKCELIDVDNNVVLATFDFANDLCGEINGKLVELVKTGSVWDYNVLNESFNDLVELLEKVGIDVID